MLSFGHIPDEYIPKWNRQPKTYEATGEVAVEAPDGREQLDYSHGVHCLVTCKQEYSENRYFVDIYPEHQLNELTQRDATCTHEVACNQQKAVDTGFTPHTYCPQYERIDTGGIF